MIAVVRQSCTNLYPSLLPFSGLGISIILCTFTLNFLLSIIFSVSGSLGRPQLCQLCFSLLQSVDVHLCLQWGLEDTLGHHFMQELQGSLHHQLAVIFQAADSCITSNQQQYSFRFLEGKCSGVPASVHLLRRHRAAAAGLAAHSGDQTLEVSVKRLDVDIT